MGEGGDRERVEALFSKVETIYYDILGIRVYTAKLYLGKPVDLEYLIREATRLTPENVVFAALDVSKTSLCRVALSYLYIVEDRVEGYARVRDANVHMLLYLTGSKQIREAYERLGRVNGIVMASTDRGAIEKALQALSGIRPQWGKGSCSPEEATGITRFRVSGLLAK